MRYSTARNQTELETNEIEEGAEPTTSKRAGNEAACEINEIDAGAKPTKIQEGVDQHEKEG